MFPSADLFLEVFLVLGELIAYNLLEFIRAVFFVPRLGDFILSRVVG